MLADFCWWGGGKGGWLGGGGRSFHLSALGQRKLPAGSVGRLLDSRPNVPKAEAGKTGGKKNEVFVSWLWFFLKVL